MTRSSLRLSMNVALKRFDVRRICVATSTFSNTVIDLNRRMFWNVRAMPRRVISSGVFTTER